VTSSLAHGTQQRALELREHARGHIERPAIDHDVETEALHVMPPKWRHPERIARPDDRLHADVQRPREAGESATIPIEQHHPTRRPRTESSIEGGRV
jgi:hypothetical protein